MARAARRAASKEAVGPRTVQSVTVKPHSGGILLCLHSKIANGLIEGINSLIQAAKAKARGYRSIRNLPPSSISSPESSTSVRPPEAVSTHTKQRRISFAARASESESEMLQAYAIRAGISA